LASKLPGYYECPELFALPLDGDPQQTKWVLFAADAEYAVGSFDGRRFTPDHEGKRRVHWGEIYASQCFSNAPGGRVVQIGWARIETPDMPFNQAFTIPTQLTLRSGADGPRLHAAPIAELEQLREPAPSVAAPQRLAAAESIELAVGETQLCDMVVTLRAQDADRAVLRFGRNRVTYDFTEQQLDEMPLPLQDGRVTFRVLVDRPLFETFGGPGTCVKTSARRDMGEPLRTISLTAVGGAAEVEHFAVHALRSIWPEPDAAIAP
jgi:sucrose-6-phosphate hydrolase SacC (GH32 family)